MQILYFQCYGSSLLFLLSLTGKTTQLLDAIQVACAGHDLSDRTRMFFTKGNLEDPSKPEKVCSSFSHVLQIFSPSGTILV